MPLVILIVVAAFVAVMGLFALAVPKSLYYRNQRPTRLGKLANRVAGRLGAIGLSPSFQVRLEVPGRRSGKMTSAPLVVGEYGGDHYLVSMLGPGAEWIKNARANGGKVVLNHRGRRPVRLEDVPVAERAPILKAYLKRAFGARRHFSIGPDASIEEFAAIADRYPAFRIVDAV